MVLKQFTTIRKVQKMGNSKVSGLNMAKCLLWTFGLALLVLPLVAGIVIRANEIISIESMIAPVENVLYDYLEYGEVVADSLIWPTERLHDNLFPQFGLGRRATNHFPNELRMPVIGHLGWNIWDAHDMWATNVAMEASKLLKALGEDPRSDHVSDVSAHESASVLVALLRYSPSRGILSIPHRPTTCAALIAAVALAILGFLLMRKANRMPDLSESSSRRLDRIRWICARFLARRRGSEPVRDCGMPHGVSVAEWHDAPKGSGNREDSDDETAEDMVRRIAIAYDPYRHDS